MLPRGIGRRPERWDAPPALPRIPNGARRGADRHMPSDNLGPFAQLTPMPASFEANVRCDRVWVAVFEVLQNFDRRRDAIKALTGIDEAQWPASRFPELLGRATAVALQQCVERGLICLYLLDPRTSRFYRLPKEALVSAFVSTTRIEGQETSARAQCTSETSWATGTLFEIDCDKALYKLARERQPPPATHAVARPPIANIRRTASRGQAIGRTFCLSATTLCRCSQSPQPMKPLSRRWRSKGAAENGFHRRCDDPLTAGSSPRPTS